MNSWDIIKPWDKIWKHCFNIRVSSGTSAGPQKTGAPAWRSSNRNTGQVRYIKEDHHLHSILLPGNYPSDTWVESPSRNKLGKPYKIPPRYKVPRALVVHISALEMWTFMFSYFLVGLCTGFSLPSGKLCSLLPILLFTLSHTYSLPPLPCYLQIKSIFFLSSLEIIFCEGKQWGLELRVFLRAGPKDLDLLSLFQGDRGG